MNSRRPVIGLNASVAKGDDAPVQKVLRSPLDYADAVASAGGTPLILPPLDSPDVVDQFLGLCDGFCLTGGPDYLPKHYGGHPQPPDDLMDERRDRFDFVLAERLLHGTAKPVLAICGGLQLVSLALGGALVQDIRKEWRTDSPAGVLPHAEDERTGTQRQGFRHSVRLAEDSVLAHTLGWRGTLPTNSTHHQAVWPERVGEGLRAVAWAEDGVIEALEPAPGSALGQDGRFIVCVQWHPERMQAEAPQRALFAALVRAAQKGR